MVDLGEQLERLTTRGEVRGVDAIVAAAFEEADQRKVPAAAPTRRLRWRAVIAIGAAAAMLLAIAVVSRREHGTKLGATSGPSASTASSDTTAPVRSSFPATARGWVFENGVVRDVRDSSTVAQFPMKGVKERPVRVVGGFVAVLANGELSYALEHSITSAHLADSVSGVTASPDGATIAYSTKSDDGQSSVLHLADVGTQASLAQLSVHGDARVVGYSYPEVLVEAGANVALWNPMGAADLTILDRFAAVQGVGPGMAALVHGDGTCAQLFSVDHGAVQAVSNFFLGDPEHDCSALGWSFNADGTNVVGFGLVGFPEAIRVSSGRAAVVTGTQLAVDAMWVDDSTVAAIDDRGELMRCDLDARCDEVRITQPPPLAESTLWLIPPRRDSSDAVERTAPQLAGAASQLRTVQMLSPTLVFAAGPGAFLRSDDGGVTWRRLIPCTEAPSQCPAMNVEQLDMISATAGWATTNQGLFRTLDGQEWITVDPTGIEHGLANVHFVSDTEGWGIDATFGSGEYIGLPDGRLVHTTDGGNTWTALSSPAAPQSVCFTQPDDGWLVTKTAVYRSTDGGASWGLSYTSTVPPTADGGLVELECGGPNTAWVQFEPGGAAAGSSPYFLVTSSDGGQDWTTVFRSALLADRINAPDGPGSYPGPFSVIDPTTAIAIGTIPGAPLVTSALVTNSVHLDTHSLVGVSLIPLAVSFADERNGVLVGYAPSDGGPPIYITNDGGAHWRGIYP